MLIHYAMVDYLPFAAYQVANGGVYKNQSENSETATKAEIDTLVEKHRGFAQFYTRRFIDYMNFNNSLFQSITKIKTRICIQIVMQPLLAGYYDKKKQTKS